MKILWLSNIMLPLVSKSVGERISPLGGWMTGLMNGLMASSTDFHFCLVSPYLKRISGEKLSFCYYTFQLKDSNLKNFFIDILKIYNPDVVHIFGTEYTHTFEMLKACEELNCLDNTVVNIQGLSHIYAKHYFAALPITQICGFSLRDLLLMNNIYFQKLGFEKRGRMEVESIRMARHIIGRTDWDEACVLMENPDLCYYKCGEILRSSFYKYKWDYNKCEKNSIFTSQSNYPIKGFHLLLDAFVEVLKERPDSQLYTTGNNPLNAKGFAKLKQTKYQKYICKLIKKNNLSNNIHFLGVLSEEEMTERLLNSNIFVLPSSIENSPNSLGEAMLLGIPCVVSNVGGVSNMMIDKIDGYLYQYDAPYMLSYYILKLLKDSELSKEFSFNASNHAKINHNRLSNVIKMIKIYSKLKKINN